MNNCQCCHFFETFNESGYCNWCTDCPTEYCDVPRKYMKEKSGKEKPESGSQ